mgnify:CR=1 FL=1
MQNNKNRTNKTPKMMGGMRGTGESAKDFKGAMKRLFKELKKYRILMIIGLTLAVFSSILSIFAPNKLSELTDEISSGLVINKDNMQLVTNEIGKNFANNVFEEIEIDGSKISVEDQKEFVNILLALKGEEDYNKLYSKLDEMPESIKNIVNPKMNMNAVTNIAIFLVVIYVLSSLFGFTEAICLTEVANKFANSLRRRISEKINKLPLKYFDRHQTGDTLSRVTNDVDMVAQTMNQSLGWLVEAIALLIGTVIMMFATNWVMAITAIVSSIIGFSGMTGILKKSQKYFIAKQEELGNLNGHIEEVYSGLNVVKVYNGKEESRKKFDEYNQKVCTANRKSQFLSGIMQPMMNFIGNLGYVSVCIVGAILTMNGYISFGVIVAFMTYVRLFTSPLSDIAQGLTQLQSTAAAAERVFEFLDEKEMSNQSEITKTVDKTKVKGEIEFNNVSFKYDEDGKTIINNFTAKALPGQKVAIVGPTGAGKTTMVNLLMKFYDINSGSIKIDGIPINELSRENVHSLFTMVLQDTWLFNGTIMENLRYGRLDATDEEVIAAAKAAHAHHFIETLPGGYNMELNEDASNVSQGQKQLLTIARAILADNPILILDEATSSVDTRTEIQIQNAMDNLMKGRTSFVIAHRLSTIKDADIILVMKEGDIVEQGNHEELLAKGGFYADLYNSQFEEAEAS